MRILIGLKKFHKSKQDINKYVYKKLIVKDLFFNLQNTFYENLYEEERTIVEKKLKIK